MTTGFANEHRGWGDRLAERSIALVSQASEMASNYVELAGVVLGRGESDSALPSPAVIQIQNEVQTRLACVQRTLVRRQAEMVRLQAMRLRVRAIERVPRTIVWSGQDMAIEVPEIPEIPDDTF
jgi:hypothetical protein